MQSNHEYQNHDGTIPDNLRRSFIHGSPEIYHQVFLITAERNFAKRCREILRAICLWRVEAPYPQGIVFKMLDMLSTGLFQARAGAVAALSDLHSISSATAVMIAPIKTV